MRLVLRRSITLFVAIVCAVPFVAGGNAGAAVVVAPSGPPVTVWGAFAGLECVNITEPGTFHSTFEGTATRVPFIGGDPFALFTYDLVESQGIGQGSWVIANFEPFRSIAGSHTQTPTRTILDGVLQVDFVDNLTVTTSSGAAAGVTGKLQLFGTRTLAAPKPGCFLNFVTSGSLLPALKQQT
jgi:hypothetical protein